MNVHEKKTLNRIFQVFLILISLRFVEEFAIANAVDTMGLLTCAGGSFILLIYLRFINKSLDEIGLLFMPHKVKKGIFMMFVLNIIPTAAVYIAEYFYLRSQSDSINFTIYYESVTRAYSEVGLSPYIGWVTAGLFVSVIHAVFYEMTFRGLIFTLSARHFSFAKSNLLQACLYTAYFLVPVLRVLAFNLGNYGIERILRLAIFIVIYEMITALKLGLLRKASGSVWICLFDHAAFSFVSDSLHIQQSIGAYTLTDSLLYYRLITYQLISLAVTVIYAHYKAKKLKEKALTSK